MTKKHKILAFTAIFLLVSSACMAVTGKSDLNSNEQPQNEQIESEQLNEQSGASEIGSDFKPYSGKIPKSGGLITNVTLALNTEGENFDPVDPSSEFGPNATIHAVVEVEKAPADTKFSAKWFTTDVGDVDAPNKLIDETETTAEGSGNLDFSLSPTTFFPKGNYRVELYINDKLDTLKEYAIVEGGPELDTSTSDTGSSDSSYIVSVTMAKGVKGLSKEPVNPTSVFRPADTVHAVVKAEGVPEGTSFTSVWLVTDIGDIAEPDTIVDTMSLDMSGDGNIDFSLSPTKPFPVGTYRVEIQIDGETAWVEEYEVK
jgi:hypothetical protein